MPYSFAFYPEPHDAPFTVKPDSGGAYSSVPYTHTDGRLGGCSYIPDTVPDNQGALLHIEMVGFEVEEFRGFLRIYPDTMTARLEVDDKKLRPAAAAPPPIVAGNTPLEIINNVWATGDYQLLTKEGCGRFTEACDTAIHNALEPMCGHLRKDPGQNQWNGHAVDAIHFLAGAYVGIWDIIQSSESPEAKPCFNPAGDAIPEKWYYPAAPLAMKQHVDDAKAGPKQVGR